VCVSFIEVLIKGYRRKKVNPEDLEDLGGARIDWFLMHSIAKAYLVERISFTGDLCE
jgi:hypothetical protein